MSQEWCHGYTFNGNSNWFGGVRSISFNPIRQIVACGSDDTSVAHCA